MALILAMLSSVCFGVALVTGRAGLRTLDARSGAAISIPSATFLLAASAPFALDIEGSSLEAALVFALVGLFFPAVVTILTFRSNEQIGPTVTSAVSGTAPLFALLAAGLFLGEKVPPQAAAACLGVVAGVALLSRTRITAAPGFAGWSLVWAIAGALVRGLAQVGAKAGLLLWANAFAASLIGYVVSSAVVISADRLGHREKPKPTKEGIAWFALTGVLNVSGKQGASTRRASRPLISGHGRSTDFQAGSYNSGAAGPARRAISTERAHAGRFCAATRFGGLEAAPVVG